MSEKFKYFSSLQNDVQLGIEVQIKNYLSPSAVQMLWHCLLAFRVEKSVVNVIIFSLVAFEIFLSGFSDLLFSLVQGSLYFLKMRIHIFPQFWKIPRLAFPPFSLFFPPRTPIRLMLEHLLTSSGSLKLSFLFSISLQLCVGLRVILSVIYFR